MAGQVSVIIPVRDGERYLAEAIESVLNQTHAALEVIVVNNGSVDRSRMIAERFGPPVRVMDEPCLFGAARARNAGVRVARGDLVAFLDADDLWAPFKLARQIDVLNARPQIDLVFTMMQDFISPELMERPDARLKSRSDAYAGLSASAMIARARSLHSAGPFPQLAVGEFIAWYGIAQSTGLKSHIIPDLLVKRRIHHGNTTRARNLRTAYVTAAKMVLDSRRAPRPQPPA